MRFKKTLIAGATLLGVTGAAFGIATPALAADAPAKHTPPTVKVDSARHTATFTTAKRGTLTVKWETLKNDKADLVTVRDANHKLVVANRVPEKKVERVLKAVEKHPGALRKLWVHAHHGKHGAKHHAVKQAS